jgi:hypothetical protein
MGFLDQATTAINSITTAVTSLGSATGLTSVLNKVTGLLENNGEFLKTLTDVKLPLKNPLFDYASYDYILGIGCLSDAEANNPDTTYMAGSKIELICKSANADPNNRVETPYGKFDFFIDNLQLDIQIGLENNLNSNVTNIKFQITEPFSMGMFPIAMQYLAAKKEHKNWRDAPWLLTMEFRGNTENGKILSIPKTFRAIPFNISNINMRVKETGAVYNIEAMPTSQATLSDAAAKFPNDVAISGASVLQLLQTGEKSLQVALNKRAALLVANNPGTVPDEYIITFPKTLASKTPAIPEDKGATTASREQINKIIGVTKGKNGYEQNVDDVNEIGLAILNFDKSNASTPPVGSPTDVYDKTSNTFFKGKLTSDPKVSDFKFNQSHDIPNAINQVILKSVFPNKALDGKTDDKGFVGWWRIDCQKFIISSDANLPTTGIKPLVYVYRVVPYDVHASKMITVNTKGPGFYELAKQTVKQYDYIYTGKNVDIINFDIYFENGFFTAMAADFLNKGADTVTIDQSGDVAATDPNKEIVAPLGTGNPPEQKLGVMPGIVRFLKTLTNTDQKGGSGPDTPSVRAARIFHDAVTRSSTSSMTTLNMEIIGDPYYIAHSGMGNWTGQSTTNSTNLLDDGSVNWQNGEVDILVNFRTPLDINQGTGLYQFAPTTASAPLISWSGLYHVTNVVCKFQKGQFTQTLSGQRRPYQEVSATSATSADGNGVLTNSKPPPVPIKDPTE